MTKEERRAYNKFLRRHGWKSTPEGIKPAEKEVKNDTKQ